MDGAITSYNNALLIDPTYYYPLTNIANAKMMAGDNEGALDAIERAAAAGVSNTEWLKVMGARPKSLEVGRLPPSPLPEDARFSPLHSEPRFIAAVETMGF